MGMNVPRLIMLTAYCSRAMGKIQDLVAPVNKLPLLAEKHRQFDIGGAR